MALTWTHFGGEAIHTPAGSDELFDNNGSNNDWGRELTVVNPPPTGASPASIESLKAPGGTQVTYKYAPNGPTAGLHKGLMCFLNFPDATPGGAEILFRVLYTSSVVNDPGYLQLETNGTLTLYNAGATIAEASVANAFTDNAWKAIMMVTDIVASTSTRFRVWLWNGFTWGSPAIDYTNSVTTVTNCTDIRVVYETAKNVTGGVMYFDDIALFDFATDTDLPVAPVYVARLQPTGNGANSDFSGSGTGTNPDWNDVKDRPNDTTTTDGTGTGSTIKRQTYALADFTLPSGGIIHAVAAYSYWNCPNDANTNPRIQVRDNSTNTQNSTVGNKTGVYLQNVWIMTTAPSDSTAWTATRVNTLETGATRNAQAIDMLISQTFAYVVYSVHPSMPPARRRNFLLGR